MASVVSSRLDASWRQSPTPELMGVSKFKLDISYMNSIKNMRPMNWRLWSPPQDQIPHMVSVQLIAKTDTYEHTYVYSGTKSLLLTSDNLPKLEYMYISRRFVQRISNCSLVIS